MTTTQPNLTIELIPLRGAIARNEPTTLDLLVKITPSDLERKLDRPPLNLGLVIDRSGSMSGAKIEYAQQAACYAIEQLLPTDRVSVTIFDDRVETIVPSTLAKDKASLIHQINQIRARGSTALHGGWVEGGIQVSQYLQPDQLNRVLLLSDGLANVGETNPDAIANHVNGLAQHGVGTTTMGVGNDYSEDLLEAMARSGDGNFYHIASPEQLPQIFQTELNGLMATIGNKVSLGITSRNGVIVADVLNDFDRTSTHRFKLPNLMVGNSIRVVVRLRVPALSRESELCKFRLAWNAPDQEARQALYTTLRLPVVAAAQLNHYPLNPEVQQQAALLMAARARQEAIARMDQGDPDNSMVLIREARQMVSSAPLSQEMSVEARMLEDLEAELHQGNRASFRKKGMSQRFDRQRSRPNP